MALILVRQEKYKKAAAAYEIALGMGSKRVSPQTLFSIYQYIRAVPEAARVAGQGKLKKTHWLKRAQALFQSAQFKTALDLLEANPQRAALPRAVLLKGKILAAMGNTEAAVKTWISCSSLPLARGENQGQLRKERDQIRARALILAGQSLWLEKKWLQARRVFKQLSRLSGYESTGLALADTMQYLIDTKP